MDLSKVFSARAITLLVFIFAVLLVGTMFNVKLGPEPFTENATTGPTTIPSKTLSKTAEKFIEYTNEEESKKSSKKQ